MGPQNEQLDGKEEADGTAPAPRGRGIWRTGLLLTTSAALGGIAVALWNRRSLERIRQPNDVDVGRNPPRNNPPE